MERTTMFKRRLIFLLLPGVLFLFFIAASATFTPQVQEEYPDACTSILVGRLASVDGSTMTSHSCDSGTDRTWIKMQPRMKHESGEVCNIYMQPKRTRGPDDPDRIVMGEISQVKETYKFMDTAYPCMNEYQLAIGETTCGGRRELHSDEGLIDAPELYRLVLERAKTAREGIRVADEITKKYGYIGPAECFTFADPKEVWHFEILGPGKGKKGAVWAAVRLPDDQIGVSANTLRIRQINLKKKDWYMASDNVHSLAEEMGWWDSRSGKPFEFCYAYGPSDRTKLYGRRREWCVLSSVAPSLNLNPESENFPLSVKPDKKVSIRDILAIFRSTYEGTEYDMTKDLTVVDRQGKTIKSPVANPFMNSDYLNLFNIKRERMISVPYATYVTVTQSREQLPDAIGGIVWLGYDNPATTPHIPFYIGISQMPESYMVEGRYEYSTDCAWWAFRRAGKLAHFRYQHMKNDVEKVWKPIEEEAFAKQKEIEEEALKLYKNDPKKAEEFLTEYVHKIANKAVADYWKLGDELWLKYSRYF